MNSVGFVCVKISWFLGCRILDRKFCFFLITLMRMVSFHCLLASITSYWKFSCHLTTSLLKGMWVHFPLGVFEIFLLSFTLAVLLWCAQVFIHLYYLAWGVQDIENLGYKIFTSASEYFYYIQILVHHSLTPVFLGLQLFWC